MNACLKLWFRSQQKLALIEEEEEEEEEEEVELSYQLLTA